MCIIWGFPGGTSGKESTCQFRGAGDMGLTHGSGRSCRGGHGNPFQQSCLDNIMDRGTWPATICGVAKSQTQLRD